MKRFNSIALILVPVFVTAIIVFSVGRAHAAGDMTASDRASAAQAAKQQDEEDSKPDVDPFAPVNNVVPYAVPQDFDGAKQQMARCAAVTDNILRIQCYDHLSTDMGVIPTKDAKQREELLGKYGFWRITSKANQVGEMLTNARLGTNKPYLSSSGIERNPEFIISCKIGSTDAYIDWKEPISGNAGNYTNKMQLVYSLDNQAGILTNWDISFDRYATFAPHALEFVRTLNGRRTMVFQGKPDIDTTATLVFSLDGLENVLKILYDRCYKENAQ